MAFPTTVQLKMGMEKVETSSQKHKLGTRGVTADGRVFYYAENSGTAIDHGGYLVDGIAAVAAAWLVGKRRNIDRGVEPLAFHL